jgi:hypothetical protein
MRAARAGQLCLRAVAVAVLAVAGYECLPPPPPRVTSVPPAGLALRVHVFGASATEVNDAFVAAHKSTPSFRVVQDGAGGGGGDGDVLVGLENDSPMCVPPTGLCSFKVSYRVRNNAGDALASNTTTINAQSDHCADLCAQAINNVVVRVLDDAATAFAAASADDTGAKPDGGKPTPKARPGAKAPPPICAIAAGPRLPTGDAEARAAQVEVLKRLGLLDQSEYDCLRKAYLGRL